MALNPCPSLTKSSLSVNKPVSIDYSLKEPVVGTQLFPAAIYLDDVTSLAVSWHWHEEFEIGFVTEGTVLLQTGSQKHSLHQGDVFFINSGIIHSMKNAVPGKQALFEAILFHGSVVGGNENSIFYQKYVLPFLKNSQFRCQIFTNEYNFTPDTFTSVKQIWTAMYDENEDYELYVRNELSSFVQSLLAHVDMGAVADSDVTIKQEHRAKIMLDFIHSYYSENITLEKIANEAYISVSESLRCFKNIIGISPIQYLKNYRLQRAAHYISSTDYSVGEICGLCGFSDHSYFTKSFKQAYHCTPQEYRENRVNQQK